MSKLTLAAALAALDAAEAAHWTEEGLPRLDVLKHMVGAAVTRDEVTKAAPSLSRASLQAAATPPAPAAAGVGADPTPPAPAAPPAAPPAVPSQGDSDAATDKPDPEPDASSQDRSEDEAIEAAERELGQMRAQLAEATRYAEEKTAALDRLIEARDAARPRSTLGDAVQAYHAQQLKVRAERARRIEQTRGINLRDILPQRSPIDEVLKNRRRQ